MKRLVARTLPTIVALIVANFLYQCFGGYDWMAACERSWFQAVAILIFAGFHQ